ncbi:TPA: hypothetical protein HA246_01300 [Candidatus Woesearchaeota archaeon]|nr:hypothetical protein [Candidatus Woesearchaeota archaeon]
MAKNILLKLQHKNRKAQMKMMENVAIMIIFFMLLTLGFIFYGKIGGHSAKQDIEKFAQQRAVKLAKIVAALPEVRCSEENVPVQDCYDLLRVESAKTLIENNYQYYLEILGYSRVAIEEKYPGNATLIIYDNQPDINAVSNIEEIRFSYIPIYIPITLFNATINQYSFGVLEVGTYDK